MRSDTAVSTVGRHSKCCRGEIIVTQILVVPLAIVLSIPLGQFSSIQFKFYIHVPSLARLIGRQELVPQAGSTRICAFMSPHAHVLQPSQAGNMDAKSTELMPVMPV